MGKLGNALIYPFKIVKHFLTKMDILEHFPTSQKLGICFRLRMGPDETFEFKKVLRGGIDCFRLQRTLWASINLIHFIHHFNHLMDTHKSNLYHTFVNIFSKQNNVIC